MYKLFIHNFLIDFQLVYIVLEVQQYCFRKKRSTIVFFFSFQKNKYNSIILDFHFF